MRISQFTIFIHFFIVFESAGFLPTFGPSWISLYGSTRDFSNLDSNRKLNEGFGEGCQYRGRILVALKTDVQDSQLESGGIRVDVEPTLPISEVSCWIFKV